MATTKAQAPDKQIRRISLPLPARAGPLPGRQKSRGRDQPNRIRPFFPVKIALSCLTLNFATKWGQIRVGFGSANRLNIYQPTQAASSPEPASTIGLLDFV